MKLYVARHGETAWNAENIICGRTDLPLTARGREQARELADRMAGIPLAAVYVSPLQRALDTARCVSERCGVPVRIENRLIEQNYGSCEGKDRLSPEFLSVKRQFAVRYPGGGESMMQVAARVYPLVDELRRRYRGKNVLLVCHGGVMRVLHSYFHDMANEDYFHFSMGNAQLMEYELPELPEDEPFDPHTAVQTLRDAVSQFNADRGWTGMNAMNMAMSISIEAAELLEIFQWCTPKEADALARETEREHFLEELADVLIYSIGLANRYGVDLSSCILDKMKKNAKKYPVEES